MSVNVQLRALYFFMLFIAAVPALADEVKSMADVYMLPPYCSGTQLIRNITRDPRPMNEYVAIYGPTYYHLHHYCWALNAENHAVMIEDQFLRTSKLTYALKNIQYVLDRSTPNFILLPEIYVTQARILFKLKRDPEAATSLIKAINARPDYVPAIIRLSEFFLERGNKDDAIKVLEQGIDHTEKADLLIDKLRRLGVNYQGVPGYLQKKDDVTKADAARPVSEPTTSAPKAPPTNSIATDNSAPPPKNPYCRFCPQ